MAHYANITIAIKKYGSHCLLLSIDMYVSGFQFIIFFQLWKYFKGKFLLMKSEHANLCFCSLLLILVTAFHHKMFDSKMHSYILLYAEAVITIIFNLI